MVAAMIQVDPIIEDVPEAPAPVPLNYVSDLSHIRNDLRCRNQEQPLKKDLPDLLADFVKTLTTDSIQRVVVRGTNWVGDAVMTVPALRALRRLLPDAEITLAIRPWARGIFTDQKFIDNVLVYDRRNAFSVINQVREWKSRQFDLAILFPECF